MKLFMASQQSSPRSPMRATWRNGIILLVLAVALYGVLPQIAGFHSATTALAHATARWTFLAVLIAASSYFLAAAVYGLLAKSRLPYLRTTAVQLASNFINRLLPAGIGALAVNYSYLHRTKHTPGQAAAVVGMNNALGFVGNMVLLAIFLLTTSVHTTSLHLPGKVWVAIGLLALGAGIMVYKRAGKKLRDNLRAFITTLASYRTQPWRLVLALGVSMLLTLSYAGCLYACARAVGLELPLAVLFICMSLGVAGATVTPTPGGLGGAEAALVASLVVYGAHRPDALAAVLLYRICTFWLPLVFGGVALASLRKRRYL